MRGPGAARCPRSASARTSGACRPLGYGLSSACLLREAHEMTETNEARRVGRDRASGSAFTDGLNVSRDTAPKKNFKRLPQLSCAYCSKPFPKTAKRPQHFCSARCRKGMARQRSLGLPEAQSTTAGRYALKSSAASVSCKAKNPFRTPLDILGQGHRWPGTPRLNRGLLATVLHREVGRLRR
jgi:hypothetical protein